MGDKSVIRVLLADDHPIVREGIDRQLEKAEDIVVVGEACTGEECLEMVERLQPDLVLLDMAMPGVDGLEVTTRLRESHPDVKVLVFSGYADDAFVFGALGAGAVGYLLKEEVPRQVASAIYAALRGETVLSDEIAQKVVRRVSGMQINCALPALSERELEVLREIARFKTNKEIATSLGITERTVEFHLSNVLIKSGKTSRREVARWAWEKGLVTL